MIMNKNDVIFQTKNHVEKLLTGEGTGHDWWHVYRVWQMAKHIGKNEQDVDMFVIELSALLHDIADWKFNNGDDKKGMRVAKDWLHHLDVDEHTIQNVCHIIEHISFKGAGETNHMKIKEGLIVQDADRLDALGAIGIARTFAYGGYKGRPLYDPKIKPILHTTFKEYKKSTSPSFNHFYEKLLLLKDTMNTQTGKQIAQQRHIFMETYIEEFLREWEGKDITK